MYKQPDSAISERHFLSVLNSTVALNLSVLGL